MIVEISSEVEDYLLYDIREVNGHPFHHANEHSRLFHQQLWELDWRDEEGKPLIDKMTVTRETRWVGDRNYDLLIFTMQRQGYQPKEICVRASDVQDRHPLTNDLLFRGHRTIEELLLPAARSGWAKEAQGQ